MKKPGKTQELTTSAQIAAWRQRLDGEQKICSHKNHMEITAMADRLESKNTYMNYFKKDEIKEREAELERSKQHFMYDVAKGDTEQKYCQKCKYESKWCKHRKEREVAKQTLGAALTTTQQYGWRAPIDEFSNLGQNRTGICKRTFFDFGHLS